MNDVVVMLLAGGRGSRLNVLAERRAKPAVPFAGNYRIIDFTLTNVMHSGLTRVGVLTQYRPIALADHISNGAAWDLLGRTRLVRLLPPIQREEQDWYHGTADAVRQNLDFIRRFDSKQVLILSGDHIYSMDYGPMLAEHALKKAGVTLAVMEVPWEETSRFGTVIADADGRVTEFDEKPLKARSNLASMGIYVFDTELLLHALETTTSSEVNDFGKHVIPALLERTRVQVHRFAGYWRDVGTIGSYWEACMDALNPATGLDLAAWKVRTNLEIPYMATLQPARIAKGAAVYNSLVSRGAVIEGTVINSVLSTGVVVAKGAVVRDSVLLHRVTVEAEAQLDRVVADNEAWFCEKCVVGHGQSDEPNRKFPEHITGGITLVGKGARIPKGARVGRNCLVGPGVTSWGLLKRNELKHGETADGKG